ncbi:hypothetical protein F5X98DRAFT_376469 [Xylaria grammica]|nr:hypothetical protein F5X98DRAFT_376469 [Xylaria grammica]
MQFHSVVAAVAAASAAVVKATPPRRTQIALPEGYEIEPMVWRGIIERGGRELSFNGTIDEVTRQIQAINTDFTWGDVRDFQASRTRPQERSSKTGILCDVGGEDAAPHGPLTANAEESGDKIAKMSGTCAVAAGPRVCAEVACTRNAAVWLCNDNVTPIAPLCSSLASYVADIVSTCGSEYYHGSRYCRGQEFDSDNYNIIVGWKSQC